MSTLPTIAETTSGATAVDAGSPVAPDGEARRQRFAGECARIGLLLNSNDLPERILMSPVAATNCPSKKKTRH